MSLESLNEIARREGIEVLQDTCAAALIDMILEAYEEDRDERESSNNYPISIEEKKYVLSNDEEYSLRSGEDEFPLPAKYNESRIVLLLRDPAWAFSYWDMKDTDVKKLKAEPGFAGVYLRVHELESELFTGSNSVDFFDIPIQFSDSKWYINLPKQGTNYCLQLYCLIHEGVRVLATSNVIRVPRGGISDEWGRGDSIDPYDMLIALSVIENLGVSSFGEKIPHRIISMLDAQYLR